MNTRYSVLVAVMAAALLIGFAAALGAAARGAGAGSREFVVRRGEGLRAISVRLAEEGIIRSARAFRLGALLTGSAGRLQPGRYALSSASSTLAIAAAIARGPAAPERALIVEGATLREVDALLASRGLIPAGALEALPPAAFTADYPFLAGAATLEGFLFPDTYHLSHALLVAEIARVFLDAFREKAWPLLAGRTDARELLVIASLLEKEVRGSGERRTVSGVIRSRLREGMPLQVDATVVYAKCREFADCPPLARSDFAFDSPWNTYRVLGLPPAPIGNPGRDALIAAREPAATAYRYYLTDPKTGRAHFSVSLDEHNEKRARYLGL